MTAEEIAILTRRRERALSRIDEALEKLLKATLPPDRKIWSERILADLGRVRTIERKLGSAIQGRIFKQVIFDEVAHV